MSIIPGQQTAFATLITERVLIQKFAPTPPDVFNVYVNSDTGSDQGQDRGPLSAPYKTIPEALSQLSNLAQQEVLIMHLAGVAPHVLPDGYTLPVLGNADPVRRDPLQPFGFVQLAPLTLRADPTLLLDLSGNITAQAFDPISGLVTVSVSVVLVPGAFAGKWALDGAGKQCVIKDNTAGALTLCLFGGVTNPLKVYQNNTIIAPAVPLSASPTLTMRGPGLVALQGVDIQKTAGGAVHVDNGASVLMQAVNPERLTVGGNGPAYVTFEAGNCPLINPTLGALSLSRSFFHSLAISNTGNCALTFTESMFFKFDPIGLDNALTLQGVPFLKVFSCDMDAANADAVHMQGGEVQLSQVKIAGSAGAAVRVEQNTFGFVTSCGGLGNAGAGLRCDGGAQIRVNPATNLNVGGAAELVVGSLPSQTWAAFHAIKNAFDATAITGQLSRVWEP